MKLRTVFLLTVVLMLLAVGATFPLVFFAADSEPAFYVVSTSAIITMFIVPALAVSFGSAWREPSDTAGRATVRRTDLVLAGVFVVGVAAAGVAGALAPAAAGYLIVVVVLTTGLTVASFILAGRLRRHNRETPPVDEAWRIIPSAEIARKVRAIILTFAFTLLVGLAVLGALALSFASGDEDLISLILFPLVLAFIAAGIAGLIGSLSYAGRLRSALGGDVTLTKRVNRVVLRRKADALEGHDLVRAAQWASIMAAYQPLQAAGSLSNVVGVALIQLNTLLFPRNEGFFQQFAGFFVVIVAVLVVVTIPLFVTRTRRARAFAEKHRDLLVEDPVPS